MQPRPLAELDADLVEFNRARVKEEVAQGLFELMRRQRVTRSRLAELLEVDKSRVSHMLSGRSRNLTLGKLADAFLVLGRAVHLTLGIDPDEVRLPADEALRGTSATSISTYLTKSTLDYGEAEHIITWSARSASRSKEEGPRFLRSGAATDREEHHSRTRAQPYAACMG